MLQCTDEAQLNWNSYIRYPLSPTWKYLWGRFFSDPIATLSRTWLEFFLPLFQVLWMTKSEKANSGKSTWAYNRAFTNLHQKRSICPSSVKWWPHFETQCRWYFAAWQWDIDPRFLCLEKLTWILLPNDGHAPRGRRNAFHQWYGVPCKHMLPCC